MSASYSELFPAGEPLRLEAPAGLDGLVPRSAVVREELGRPYELELELESTGARIEPGDLLGRPLALLLNLDGTNARYFHGLVSELERLGQSGASACYRVTLRPWLWFLSRTQSCRIFQRLSVPEIIKQVFRGHEFADFEEQLSASHEPREFVVQYRESDLAFVSRLMEAAGLHCYFRHARESHTLVLCDANSVRPELAPPLPFQPHDARRDEHVEYVDQFAAVHRVEADGFALQHFDYERPSEVLTAQGGLEPRTPGPLEVYDYPTVFSAPEQAEALLGVALDRRGCKAERYRGRSNARGLGCGQVFTLAEHPWPENDGAYLVVSSTFRVAAHDPVSTTPGLPARGYRELIRCEFEAVRADQPFVLPPSTPRPCIAGAQTAIVAGPSQQEIWADPEGRVQLRFHWDRRRSGAEPASCWVRVSQLWAGAGFGGAHLPRVGDEVVVQFLDGDPDRPLVVGRVYNGTHESPYDPGRKPSQSGIRSATLGGTLNNYNELCFDDHKGAELLRMQAERDHSFLIKHDRSIEIGADDSLLVGADQLTRISGALRLCVGEEADANPGTPGEAIIVTDQRIELRCGKSVLELTAERCLVRCGESTIELRPDRITLVGGSAFLSLEGDAELLSADGAKLVVNEDVVLRGKNIKLNS
ncbi:MAG: hypothetical protein RL033_1565 [Pseudomonadota bacterium]|jgi:type VI secretion system secreted protein VgrG